MSKLNIPVDTATLAWLGKLRGDRTWTQTLEAMKPATIPAWTFGIDDASAHIAPPSTLPYSLLYDFTEDTHINSGDKAAWMALGVPQTKPVVSAYTVEDLIRETTMFTQGHVCPPVDTYDWGIRGHGLTGAAPQGDEVVPWGTCQWRECGVFVPGSHYQCRNYRAWGLKSDHTWVRYGGGFEWVDTRDVTTDTGGSGEPAGTHSITEADWVMPQAKKSIHWATYHQPNIAGVTLGVVVAYEARGAGLMANAGFDHYRFGQNLYDLFISGYKALDAVEWRTVAGSSVTAEILRQYPPPL